MFISKWRYERNLENARQEGVKEGIKAGKREANEQKFAYIDFLEEENKALQEKMAVLKKELTEARVAGIQVADKLVEDDKTQVNKAVVEAFAQELACWQKMADVAYYVNGNQEESSSLVDKAFAIKELANKLGICGDVYERAYQIYDFRNSGKEGYTLKDGKIVKIEQEEEMPQSPFVEETAHENHTDGSECEGCPGWCPENAGTSDCPVNGSEACDDEATMKPADKNVQDTATNRVVEEGTTVLVTMEGNPFAEETFF